MRFSNFVSHPYVARTQQSAQKVSAFGRLSRLLVMFTVAIACLATNPTARAQVLYGTLTGTVTDSTGAVITGATVKAENKETGFNRTEQSNAAGIYKFSDLIPGSYVLTIEAPNYGMFRQEKLPILVNNVQRVDASLQIGSLTQSVSVTDRPPTLQTDSAQTAYTLDTQQLSALPVTSTTGRNFQSLFKIVPGATPPAESNSAAGNPQRSQAFNVNGIGNVSNTTRLDGALDTYPVLPTLVAYLPPIDGIASINLVMGSYNAEQGTAGGAAVNVTLKSGTNKFHGSLFEYNSIAQFNAQAWQNRTGVRQKNLLNEFGLSFGGPIFKDKLFFFVDWDRVKTSKIATAALNVSTIPTQALGQGGFDVSGNANFSTASTTIIDPTTGTAFAGNLIPANRISPAAKTLLGLLPHPNTTPTVANTQVTNNYSAFPTTHFERDNVDAKINYNATSKTTFFGHYSFSPDTINDPQMLNLNGGSAGGVTVDGGQPGNATGLVQNIGLNATHLFTSNVLVDADFGFTRQRLEDRSDDIAKGDFGTQTLNIPGTNNNGDPDYAGIPGFFFAGFYDSIGNANTANPFKYRDNQETGDINLSWTRGKHGFRFGSEYLHAALNHLQPGSLGAATSTPRGGFTFTGAVTTLGSPTQYNVLADFLLGLPQQEGKQIQLFNPLTYRGSTFAFFAQDTWQATPALTVNYGVRYEFYPLPISDKYGLLRYDPTVQTTITDIAGTHNAGTTLVGGRGGLDNSAGTNNHYGQLVPRAGVSYRIDSKTVIRSGFGITIDPENLRTLLSAYPQNIGLTQLAAGHAAAGQLTAPTAGYIGSPSLNLLTGIPAIPVATIQGQFSSGKVPLPSNIQGYTIPQDFRRGYIESYNLAVQRELPGGMSTTMTYVGSHQVRGQSLYDINGSPVNGGNTGRFLNAKYGANTSNSEIYSILPFQGASYNALQAQLTSNTGKPYSYGVVYTYSKTENAADNGQLGTLLFVDPAEISKNYSRASYDRKHNFQFWSILQSPFGRGGKSLMSHPLGYLLGGWQLTNILSRVSGTPFNVTASGTTLNAPGNTQVADYVGGPSVLNGNASGFRQYLNVAAFAPITTARFGNTGRNFVRGPGIFNLDTSVARTFPIYREADFIFQADVFDITNTPQFANPTANISAPASFGILTTSNVNRTMRLSARITF